jgi:hypothetical protein
MSMRIIHDTQCRWNISYLNTKLKGANKSKSESGAHLEIKTIICLPRVILLAVKAWPRIENNNCSIIHKPAFTPQALEPEVFIHPNLLSLLLLWGQGSDKQIMQVLDC